MSGFDGISRLRKAVDNQASLGEAAFMLPIGEMLAILDEVEAELAGVSWAQGVPAPRDADGEVVPLDTEVLYREDGGKCKVAYWAYYPNEKDSWTAVSDVMGTKRACIHKTLHLTPPDSWEKLEEDVARIGSADCPCDYFNHHDCGMPCDSCPAHTDAEDCIAELARDVLRRAKALAERDAKWSTPQPLPHEAKDGE
jgi:hypothetical protein